MKLIDLAIDVRTVTGGKITHRLEMDRISSTDVECRLDGKVVHIEIFKIALAMCELGRWK